MNVKLWGDTGGWNGNYQALRIPHEGLEFHPLGTSSLTFQLAVVLVGVPTSRAGLGKEAPICILHQFLRREDSPHGQSQAVSEN